MRHGARPAHHAGNVSLRLRVLGVGCVGVAGVMLAAGALCGPLGLGEGYPAVAALLFGATMTLAVVFAEAHPFPVFGPANLVTTARAALLALTAALIGQPVSTPVAAAAIVMGVAAILLDGADGYLARRTGIASAYGARFDMETDGALVLALSLLVWLHGKAGAWVLLGGLMRYAFVAAGWVWPWMRGSLSPTFRAKLLAISHLVGLTVALAPFVRMPFSAAAAAITLAGLAWSFSLDVGRLRRAGGRS